MLEKVSLPTQQESLHATEELIQAFKDLPQNDLFENKKTGSLIKLLYILISFKRQLQHIRHDLTEDLLRPIDDLGSEGTNLYQSLSPAEQVQVDHIRQQKNEAVTAFGKSVLEKFAAQQITFSRPERYVKQQTASGCAVATFCSLYESITGLRVSEEQLFTAARSAGHTENIRNSERISESVLYALLPENATVYPYLCCDFSDLEKLISKAEQSLPSDHHLADVYCTATIRMSLATKAEKLTKRYLSRDGQKVCLAVISLL